MEFNISMKILSHLSDVFECCVIATQTTQPQKEEFAMTTEFNVKKYISL